MNAILVRFVALASAFALVACAGGGRGGDGRPDFEGRREHHDAHHTHGQPRDGDGPGGPPRRMLFISPMGEPFRAPPGAPYPITAWFSQADANHDGVLNKAEFVADAMAFFTRLDIDHDGVIDGFEVAGYERDIAPEIIGASAGDFMPRPRGGRGEGPRRRGGGGAGSQRMGAAPYSLLNDAEPVSSADRTLTQRISKADFAAAAAARFVDLHGDESAGLRLATLPKTPVQQAMEARATRRLR